MVTRSRAFPTKWLKPGDLNGQPIALKIERAAMETVKFKGKEQKKLVLYFFGTGKSLLMNATNFDSIEEITGQSDSDNWPNHTIEVYATTTEVEGETKDCIRVRSPAQKDLLGATAPNLPPAPPPAPASDMDDEIPF
jgi:hypothetical protein